MPKPANKPSIPLVCNICPKCPQFSDLSHLLTHVSSKSHLSCKFQKTILAGQDQEAYDQLAQYERWYIKYNIAGLLADRMNVKENKKAGASKRKKNEKAEPKGDDVSIKSENINPALYNLSPAQAYRPPMPPMQAPGGQCHGYSRFESTPVSSDFGGDSAYDTPTMSDHVPNFRTRGAQKRKAANTTVKGSTKGLEKKVEDDDEDQESTHRVLPASQLKGTIWPGMDLFDSATPEMQRRRNQKKDGKILAQMMITSLTTEPTEVIYNPDFSFRRSRPIFDNSDDEEEGQVTAPTPVKRRSRARAPLKKIDGNVSRTRKQSPKKAASRNRGRQPRIYDENGPMLGNINHSFPSRSTSTHTTISTRTYDAPSIDGEEEYYAGNVRGPVKQHKRRLIKVFHDDDQPSLENNAGGSPARTESSMQEARYDDFQQEYYQQAPSRYVSSPFAHHLNQVNARGMAYVAEPPKDSMEPEHLYVTEREAVLQYGHLHPSPAYMPNPGPGFVPGRQYFQEPATINPLRAQIQPGVAVFPSAYYQDPYPYGLQSHHASNYLGNFRPVDVNPVFQQTPPPAFLRGGPGPLHPNKPGVEENGGNEGYGNAQD